MHYSDPICFIIFCDVHRVPMIVLRRHSPWPNEDELKYIERVRVNRCGDLKFRGHMSSIPTHWHEHLEGDWTTVFKDDLPRNFLTRGVDSTE